MSKLVRLTMGTMIAVGKDVAWCNAHPAETTFLLACVDFTESDKLTADERIEALVRGHDNYRAFRAEHDGGVTNWPPANSNSGSGES